MKLAEDIIQAQIFKWYHNNFCLKNHNPSHSIFAVPNGGLRNKKEASKLKSTGVVAGVSDLIIIEANRVLFVEVKTETGTQSPKQKDFQKKVEVLGYRYLLVRSLEDFKNQIQC
jgi:hypothetical protein